MKEKIINVLGKIKNFSLMNFLLGLKIKGLLNDMKLKSEMIIMNQKYLNEAQDVIPVYIRIISNLGEQIKELESKIKDIKKIK